MLLRTSGNTSVLTSLAASTSFTAQQLSDLARYLDVTRAEMLFGRGVILVEGDAERFIVPAAARLLDPPFDLDEYGMSVSSVAGTDFVPYAKLLRYFGIPCAVVTDGDGDDATVDGARVGIERALDVLRALGTSTKSIETQLTKGDVAGALVALAAAGLFVGRRTLEADILELGAGSRMAAAFKELRPGTKAATLAPFSSSVPLSDTTEATLIGLLERPGVGKGRFAQRFAEHMAAPDVPTHVRGALKWIITRVAP